MPVPVPRLAARRGPGGPRPRRSRDVHGRSPAGSGQGRTLEVGVGRRPEGPREGVGVRQRPVACASAARTRRPPDRPPAGVSRARRRGRAVVRLVPGGRSPTRTEAPALRSRARSSRARKERSTVQQVRQTVAPSSDGVPGVPGVPGAEPALGDRLVAGPSRYLAPLTDLMLARKQAHRRVAGREFARLRALFDRFADEIRAAVGLAAERAVALGGAALSASPRAGTCPPGRAAGDGTGARRGPAVRSLRDALRTNPAGPEVLAALGPVADRPLPVAAAQWSPTRWEAFIDASLDDARARSYAAWRARQRPPARPARSAPRPGPPNTLDDGHTTPRQPRARHARTDHHPGSL